MGVSWAQLAGHDRGLTIAAIALSRLCNLGRGKSIRFGNMKMLEDLGNGADIGLLHVVIAKGRGFGHGKVGRWEVQEDLVEAMHGPKSRLRVSQNAVFDSKVSGKENYVKGATYRDHAPRGDLNTVDSVTFSIVTGIENSRRRGRRRRRGSQGRKRRVSVLQNGGTREGGGIPSATAVLRTEYFVMKRNTS